MGLLDSVIGALGQSQGQGGGGGQGALLNMVLGMLANSGGGAGGAGAGGGGAAGGLGGLAGMAGGLGGLAGLADKFQQNGMGDIMNSWIGMGENKPVAPEALGGLLGNDMVAGMAKQLGVNNNDLLGQLAQMLPQVVDKLTPQGQMPAGGIGGAGGPDLGQLAGMLGGLLKR